MIARGEAEGVTPGEETKNKFSPRRGDARSRGRQMRPLFYRSPAISKLKPRFFS